jgi:hypothetical protein
VNIRTGMLTSQTEMVPLQIGRVAIVPGQKGLTQLERPVFPGLKSYASRLHNEYIAGISLWTVWTSPLTEAGKTA